MARIRSVHPGLFTDEAFMRATMPARMLSIGLWCEAKDDGVFEWKPLTLKVRLFPADDNLDVPALLDELVALNMITRFEHGGRSYGAVRNFCRYQHPRKPNTSGVRPAALQDYVGATVTETPKPDEPKPAPRRARNGAETAPVHTPVPHQYRTSTVPVHEGEGEGEGVGRKRSSTTTNPALRNKSTSSAGAREAAPPEISIQDLGLSSSSLAAYTDAELLTLQTEFGAIDVAALIPELLAWCSSKAIPPLEQRSAVYGALQLRQAKAELTARARAPPAQIAVSDALRASLQRRRA